MFAVLASSDDDAGDSDGEDEPVYHHLEQAEPGARGATQWRRIHRKIGDNDIIGMQAKGAGAARLHSQAERDE